MAPGEDWRTEGSVLMGLDLLRNVIGGGAEDAAAEENETAKTQTEAKESTGEAQTEARDDDGESTAAEAQTQARATVVGWLPKEESDFLDDRGRPAALYRIRYVDGNLAGDVEDLEEHEVRASVPYDDRIRLMEREQILFEEAEERGLDVAAVTPAHHVTPRSPLRVMLPLVLDDEEDSDNGPAPATCEDAAPPPKRRRTAAVGDRVVLTLDALKGVVTKENKRTGWFTVKFEDGDMDSFRAAELRVI